MGQRSRKRGRRPAGSKPARAGVAPAPKHSRPGASPDAQPPAGSDPPRTRPARPSRSELRNERARASLEPLAPGERPGAVTVAAILAAVLAIANVGLYVAGVRVKGGTSTLGGVLVFGVLMLVAAGGMWRARYWAVLGFQALLALSILISALSLVRASNVAAIALCLAVIVLGGLLFVKLIRALARLQMPDRRPRP